MKGGGVDKGNRLYWKSIPSKLGRLQYVKKLLSEIKA